MERTRTNSIEYTNWRMLIRGYLKGRKGRIVLGKADVIGQYREMVKNSNGQRLINFCRWNNLIVANKFFHNIRMFTSIQDWSRDEMINL